jgi:hypothetical protein
LPEAVLPEAIPPEAIPPEAIPPEAIPPEAIPPAGCQTRWRFTAYTCPHLAACFYLLCA